MSSERLEELGVHRRAFLKKAGAAALAAPLIVSFGMDAIAEGSPNAPTKPNQCFANQTYPNQQLEPGRPLWDILDALLCGLFFGGKGGPKELTIGNANPLADLAILAALQEANREYLSAYQTWTNFIAQVNSRSSHMPPGLAEYLIEEATRARAELDCN